ncbi:MAG: hypothetical protein CR988_05645 [Treponema sp.]|nr:MAG: hypothetical protein CR988_05645 [Treponema sp.]
MKKVFLLFVFIFALTGYACIAEEYSYENKHKEKNKNFVNSATRFIFDFDFDLGFGISVGEAHELVYSAGNIASDLRWPMYPFVFIFANMRFELKQGFNLKFNSVFSPRIFAGKLTDKDYKYKNGVKKKVGDSIHDAFLLWQYSLGGTVGWKFNLPQTEYLKSEHTLIFIEPLLGVEYSRQKWKGIDGHGTYDWYGYKEYSGTQITYELQRITTSIGLDLHFVVMPKEVYVKTGFEIMPYYFSNSLDYHILRNKRFYDEFKTGGFGLGINTEVKWLFSKYIGLTVGAEYKFMLNKKGMTKTYSGKILTAVYPKGSAGQTAEYGKMSVGFFVRAKK